VNAPPKEIVAEYFARVRAEDPRVADLFALDGRLCGLGMSCVGRPAIEQFYRRTFAGKRPVPRFLGPMMAEGERVAVEISIEVADGLPVHVVDLFEVEDGSIRSLTYFVAEHPPA